MTVTERVAYIRGLFEGLEINVDKKEGRLFKEMITLLEDMALSITDLEEENDALQSLENVATPDEPTPTNPGSTDPTDPGKKPGQPSTDPASATKPASTSDTPGSTVSGGAVQTGEATYAVILLVVLAAVSGVVVFTRKKYN